MQLIILVAMLALCAFNFVGALLPVLSRSAIQRSHRLYGKIAKNEEKPAQGTGTNGEPESITLPYNGMVGYEPNNLFYEPIDVSDPLKDTSELPGEDGSDEKIEAIQARIQARVDVLKKTGQWDAYEGGYAYTCTDAYTYTCTHLTIPTYTYTTYTTCTTYTTNTQRTGVREGPPSLTASAVHDGHAGQGVPAL
jgi:hypothetical protein